MQPSRNNGNTGDSPRRAFVLTLSALVFAFVFGGAFGCSDTPTKAQCTKLVDHIIDLEIKAAGTDKLPAQMKADLDKQRQELKEYVRESSVKKCVESLPLSVVECGIAAKTLEERAACEK